jgi:hypothetical protein
MWQVRKYHWRYVKSVENKGSCSTQGEIMKLMKVLVVSISVAILIANTVAI